MFTQHVSEAWVCKRRDVIDLNHTLCILLKIIQAYLIRTNVGLTLNSERVTVPMETNREHMSRSGVISLHSPSQKCVKQQVDLIAILKRTGIERYFDKSH